MSRIEEFAGQPQRPRGARRSRPSRALGTGALALAATLIMLVGAQAASATGTTLYVSATGTDTSNTTCEESTPCKTIGHAVVEATGGDTIKVALGTYAEKVTINTNDLTLEGAQAGKDAGTRSGSESIVESFAITASDVTIDGFKLSAAGSQLTVTPSTLLSGVVVEDDIFSGYKGVALTTNDAGNILVKQNLFANPAAASEPIQFKPGTVQGSCDGTEVIDNVFNAATNNGGADVNFSCTGSNSKDVTVSGNTTTGNTGGSSFVAISGVVDGIQVTDNTGTTSGSSIFFFGSVSGSALIEGNTITGGGSSAVSIHGADITADTANTGAFTITNNTLTGNVNGIYVAKSALGSGANVVAHFNDLAGNSEAGIQNKSSVATVDATNNWWGCNAGPSHSECSSMSTHVNYVPWLILKISAVPSLVSIETSSTLTADLTHNSRGEDTSSSGTIPDGTPIDFATGFGSVSAASAPTSAGNASVTLESTEAGTANASATLDNQTVDTLVVFSSLSNYAVGVLSDHPIGYWRLGDALDTSIMSDATGKYPGEYKNGNGGSPQLGISGDGNKAAYFVGGGQYGEVKNIDTETFGAEEHQIHDGFTMEAWVLPNHDGEAQMIMQQGGSGALYINKAGHFVFVPDSNEAGVYVQDPETVGERLKQAEEHAPGKAHFIQVAGTWETWNEGPARLYVNGKEVEYTTTWGTNDKPPWGSATFYIGYGDLAPWFSGYIDEAAYYDYALEPGRIQAHYEADPPPPLLVPLSWLTSSSSTPAGTAGASTPATTAVKHGKPAPAHAHKHKPKAKAPAKGCKRGHSKKSKRCAKKAKKKNNKKNRKRQPNTHGSRGRNARRSAR